jgi:CRISPR-associated protein Csy2
MTKHQTDIDGLLVLPRLRIQNANAISSPLTWGFPSITAFTGLMHALERKLKPAVPLGLRGVGVICHHFEAQATTGGYTHAFHLTRNPVDKTGANAAIVEEGRVHLDITLVFGVEFYEGFPLNDSKAEAELVRLISNTVSSMRVAGGSVIPSSLGQPGARASLRLLRLGSDFKEREQQFRRARRQWLPGFALVSRDDLLQERLAELRSAQPDASALDAWLDLSRLNHRSRRSATTDAKTGAATETVEWTTQRRPGWIVPIPVGYGALSEVYPPGAVTNARDATMPFRFVESLYSMGQWISPHRLRDASELLWRSHADPGAGLYRCVNAYRDLASPLSSSNDN